MWHDVKQLIKSISGFTDVALHLGSGAAIFLVIAAMTKRPTMALMITAGIAVANEAVDLVEDATGSGWLGSVYDVLWTLILPAAAFIVVKLRSAKHVAT